MTRQAPRRVLPYGSMPVTRYSQVRANQESGKQLGSALLLVFLLDHLLLLVAKPGLPDDLRLKVQVYPEARIEKL
jgi:hypothetical protein